MTIPNPELITPKRDHVLAETLSYKQPAPSAYKAKKKKWLGLVLRSVMTLLLFGVLFKSLNWSAVWSTFIHIHRSVALVALTTGFYTLVVSAYQWQSLLRNERINVDLTKLINLYMIGIAFSHFLPTSMGGDVVKAYYIGRESNNASGSASAIVMARITGFFGMLLVAYPALLIWQSHFTQQISILLIALSCFVLLLIAGAFFFATIFARLLQTQKVQSSLIKYLPRFIREKLVRIRLFSKAIDIGNTLMQSIKQPGSMIIAILFGVMFHIIACVNYFSYGLALRMDVPFYAYLVAIPLISLIAFLPISINGFGLRESALVFIFSTFHVPATTSLLLAFVMDLQMLFFGALGGCIYLLMGNQKKRKPEAT